MRSHAPTLVQRLAATIAAMVAGVVVASLLAAPAQSAPQGFAPAPVCARQMRTHQGDLNVGFPETNATYWVQPYNLGVGDWIELDGTYPAARYFSINSYGFNFTAANWLHDTQIRPDAGSRNPYSGQGSGPGRKWTMRVIRDNRRANPARNEISAPAQGLLIQRVYVPNNPASPNGGAPLPTVTFHSGGQRTTLQPCANAWASRGLLGGAVTAGITVPLIGAANATFPPTLPEARFVNPLTTDGLLANGEGRYLGAMVSYRPGRVVVVRGKAPSFGMGKDLRYWSMCTNDRIPPYPVTSCAADFRTRLDAQGYYTYVVAAPSEVRAASLPGVTIIPWGSTVIPQHVLVYREMLPSGAYYPRSVMSSQARRTNPAVTMGSHFPRATYCDVNVLRRGGVQACYR